MKKEDFKQAIEAIRKQSDHDKKWSKKLRQLFNDCDQFFYDNHFINNGLIRILKSETGDVSPSKIEAFCFDWDFGRSKQAPKEMKTVDALWEFLKEN